MGVFIAIRWTPHQRLQCGAQHDIHTAVGKRSALHAHFWFHVGFLAARVFRFRMLSGMPAEENSQMRGDAWQRWTRVSAAPNSGC